MTDRRNSRPSSTDPPTVSCEPERITGYVDGALEGTERLRRAAHLEGCAACQAQLGFETRVRQALRALPALEPSAVLEARVRGSLHGRRRVAPWTLPVAAGLVLGILWSGGSSPVLAGQLVQDHANCHSVRSLALDEEGDADAPPSASEAAELRSLPREVRGLTLAAASVCELGNGALVLHVQYVGQQRRVSLFVGEGARFRRSYSGRVGGSDVRLASSGGRIIGLVGEDHDDLDAFLRALLA